jgi:two-component system response regulator
VNDHAVELLLVEDSSADIELTLHAFGKHELANKVHVARDGQEALDYLFPTDEYGAHTERLRPKVILLDLKLPRVDGLEVLREIRADPTLHAVPVVIVTSSRERRDVKETYDLGANSYIVKPIEFDAFIETMETLGLYWLVRNEPPPAASESTDG